MILVGIEQYWYLALGSAFVCIHGQQQSNEKSAKRDANTVRWYSKVEPKIFATPQTPSRGCRMAKI